MAQVGQARVVLESATPICRSISQTERNSIPVTANACRTKTAASQPSFSSASCRIMSFRMARFSCMSIIRTLVVTAIWTFLWGTGLPGRDPR
ncbi:hypothetical protein BDV12DRAFT_173250 [Aspergillus spectabilis]